MKTFLITLWEKLRSNYWFVPTSMAVSATGFSFLTIHIDGVINAKWARAAGWLWAGETESARSVLSTIAGSKETPRLPDNFAKEACMIRSKKSGFIEAIADEDLKFAAQEKLVIRMRRRPGDFVAEGSTLAEIWNGSARP